MQLDKQLYDEINDYCKLNNIKTRDFVHKILKEAFLKEKYGDFPFNFNKPDEHSNTENHKSTTSTIVIDNNEQESISINNDVEIESHLMELPGIVTNPIDQKSITPRKKRKLK